MSFPNYKLQGTKQGLQISGNTINTDLEHLHDSFLHQGYEDEEEEDEEELIEVVLRRRYPSGLPSEYDKGLMAGQKEKYELDGKVRKTFSMRTEQDENSSVVERAVRRAFSMRASSASGNEVYRRIDHQYDPVPVGDEETNTIMAQKRNNKVLEACRRFFGF